MNINYKCSNCSRNIEILKATYKKKTSFVCQPCSQKIRFKDAVRVRELELETKHLGTQKVKVYWDAKIRRSKVIYKCTACLEEKETIRDKFKDQKKHLYCHDCYQKSREKQIDMRI